MMRPPFFLSVISIVSVMIIFKSFRHTDPFPLCVYPRHVLAEYGSDNVGVADQVAGLQGEKMC